MQSSQLIRMRGVLDLQSINMTPNNFKFGACTFESDKYICIRDEQADSTVSVVVIELQNNNNVVRRPMKAEAALMNPTRNVIALKAKSEKTQGHFVQVYNLDEKQRINVQDFTEPIIYWKWISTEKLACCTSRSVYTWNISGGQPVKLFDRAGALAEQNAQIINISMDKSEKWCFLQAISTPDGGKTICGHVQLYQTELSQTQILEGHAACFTYIPVSEGSGPVNVFCFTERKQGDTVSKLHLMEIDKPTDGRIQKFKRSNEIQFSPESPNDFPLSLQTSSKHGVLYLITKEGYLLLFELASGYQIYRQRISDSTVFVTTKDSSSEGIMCINRKGQVIWIGVDDQLLIPFIANYCKHIPDSQTLSFTLAKQYKLRGADDLFVQDFNRLIALGDVKGAASVAASAPDNLLRNEATINKFKQMPVIPGQQSPMMQYFLTLLERCGKLNTIESLEIAKPMLTQGKKDLLISWIKEGKIEISEQLGDLVNEKDPSLALQIHLKSAGPQKIILGLIQTGQFDKIVPYCTQNNYSPNWKEIVQQVCMVAPQMAQEFCKQLANNTTAKLEPSAIVDTLLGFNQIQAVTAFLLEYLKEDKEEQGHLQTRLLEINLLQAHQVAEAIMQMNMFHYYDKIKIAQLCEQKQLYQRALENYTDINDIKRVMLNTHLINQEFLIAFFGNMTPNDALQCLYELLRTNRSNLQIVVQVAIKYHEHITIPALLQMFESFGAFEGIFYFLGSILTLVEDNDVTFKYIEAAVKLNNMKEVERVIKETTMYDPEKVKNFLKDQKIDPKPLIYLCDKHGYLEELTRYLVKQNFTKHIEAYLLNWNPKAAPVVLACLLELDKDEQYVKQLLNSLRASVPIEEMIIEFENRKKLEVLQVWLEDRQKEGNQLPALHTALAKIYVLRNKDPQTFLINNNYYNFKEVGKFCEDKDPHLAYTAYKRAWGECDKELVDLTNRHSLYRLQAQYLVERQDLELWDFVLQEENEHRRPVIDQVVASALPDSKDKDEVGCAVKAFIKADLQKELIELLEKIVLHNSDFCRNKNLQNLLIWTAMKSNKTKVMDYIHRLDNYDAEELANIALGEPYNLYEEAFEMYRKYNMNEKAVDVLLFNIQNIEKAVDFATKIGNNPVVWTKLGKAQLDRQMIEECIDSFLKAQTNEFYMEVIEAAEALEKYQKLIDYLLMIKRLNTQTKDAHVDSELAYSYAKCNRLTDLEEYINGSHAVDVSVVGDRLYDEQLYEAARILFASIHNHAKLAQCYIKLLRFGEALEAAKKANNSKTWKELNMACVEAREFGIAKIAGLAILVHADLIEDVIYCYEKFGYIDELLQLLEQGLSLERAPQVLFTELGIVYAKHRPEKLMDYIRAYVTRINIPKLLRACERYQMWPEAVFLYIKYDEFDNAVACMMEHSPSAFTHEQFLQTIQKVTNQDLYYKSIIFYMDEEPSLVNELLKTLAPRLELSRTVSVLKQTGYIAISIPFLQSVQVHNIPAVNEALNDLYFEAEDYASLRKSVVEFDAFEQLQLASRCERHELLEFRRIAALLYRNNQRWDLSLNISKADSQYKDCCDTALQSKNTNLINEMLFYFRDNNLPEGFVACTYTCYEHVRPETIQEIAWIKNWQDFAMPFYIQLTRDMHLRLAAIEKKAADKEKKEESEKANKEQTPIETFDPVGMMMPGLNQFQALMPPPPMPPMGGMGMGMGFADPSQMGFATGYVPPRFWSDKNQDYQF